ncbi:hypothetical protein GH714_018521 [Hevea brasiliensis]|uniref:Protein kinase domain-containing protein n=1 Tax=Hevea brasiliensis TaxID=3981 RepID=A0A6A6KTH0_HEVBR|nr:hypothetical protein GH714_018521 [Hevea brasiliensis]
MKSSILESPNTIVSYNRDRVPNMDSVQAGIRINIPFPCDCINGEFLGHVFQYNVVTGDTYDVVANRYYSNLTTVNWLKQFNSYPENNIPDTGALNVTVNCSCGIVRFQRIMRYNVGANFSQGSGLVYIPGKGIAGGVIAGISIGAVAVVLLVAVIVYFGFYQKKKLKKAILLSGSNDLSAQALQAPGSNSDKPVESTGLAPSPVLTGITVDKSVEFSYEELAQATDNFSMANKIGEGGFGSVYYAELRNEKAAIKKMDMQASKEFFAELKVLTHVHHLNLVRLIGYCVEGSLFLVYEYIENGNLSQHLRGSGRDPLPWSARVQIALDSARGLEYIHEHTVPVYIHRDIKYAQYGDVSPKVDVYAFGVVLYELISAKDAIVKINGSSTETRGLVALFEDALNEPDPKEELCKLIDPRLGDNYPADSVRKMAQLAKACTQENPHLRPSMRSIVVALMTLSSSTEDWDVGSFYENQALVNLMSGR